MRIGELATRPGRSVHTIRWYEAQSLMPGVARDAGGRRVYSDGHVGWLELLDRLRRTGMSIRQMQEYAALIRQGDGSVAQRREIFRAHRKRVKAMMADLASSLELIDQKINFYARWLSTGRRPRPAPRKGR